MDEDRTAKGETASGVKYGWRLFHYLSSGGVEFSGRTVAQDEAAAKRSRFAAWCAAFAAFWLFFWFL